MRNAAWDLITRLYGQWEDNIEMDLKQGRTLLTELMWLWLCIFGALVKVILDCIVSIKWGIC